jgi:hypothetical protein
MKEKSKKSVEAYSIYTYIQEMVLKLARRQPHIGLVNEWTINIKASVFTVTTHTKWEPI